MKFISKTFTGVTLCALALAQTALADAPAGYYNSLEGKTGVALKKAVKAVVKQHHVKISYNEVWDAFRYTDVKTVNGVDYWWDMYSNEMVEVKSGKPDNGIMNIEHTVAKSWWGKTKNNAYSDICHLNPSNSRANSAKSNYPMAKVSRSGKLQYDNGVTFVGSPMPGMGEDARYVYEPHDEYKGDMARVFMYMFTVYDDISWQSSTNWMYDTSSDLLLKPWAYNMLLEWSANDPVSQKERNRNDGIMASKQKGRNPFIDLPDLAEYIWGDKSGQPYHVDGDHTVDPVDPTDPDPDVPTDPTDPDPEDPTPENPSAKAGTYVLVASQGDIRAGEQYLILGKDSHVAMSTSLNNKTKGKGYFSPTSEITITGGNLIESAPSDAALITIENINGGYALRMSDLEGNDKGYVFCSALKNLDFTDYITTDGVKTKINYTAQGVEIIYGESKSTGTGALYYNANSPRFTTYTSDQEHLVLYRKVKETSAVEEIEDNSFLVEVWGNNILVPAGARIFDLNGREFNGENLARGIYIVTSPTFRKAVKVMIK